MGADDPVAALAEADLPPPAREAIESTTAIRFLGL